MSTKTELDRLWQLAGQLNEARSTQAKAQGAALDRQKAQQHAANKKNWFGPTLGAAASGAVTGFMAGGPMGALAGGAIGAGVGYLGHEKFNENPSVLPALGQAASSIGIMSAARKPLATGGQPGQTGESYMQGASPAQEFNAARGLSLTPGLKPPMNMEATSNMIGLGEPTVNSGPQYNQNFFNGGDTALQDAADSFNNMQEQPAATPLDSRFNTLNFQPDTSGYNNLHDATSAANNANNFENNSAFKGKWANSGRRGKATGKLAKGPY